MDILIIDKKNIEREMEILKKTLAICETNEVIHNLRGQLWAFILILDTAKPLEPLIDKAFEAGRKYWSDIETDEPLLFPPKDLSQFKERVKFEDL